MANDNANGARPGSGALTEVSGAGEPGRDESATEFHDSRETPTLVGAAPAVEAEQPAAVTAGRLAPDAEVIKGRFVLEERLGKGGMAQVFKARDLRKEEAQDDQPWVAIKFLGEKFSKHPKALISLQREAKKSQQLAHPNVVTVYDFDRDGERVFMTMEFLQGQPLSRWESLHLPGKRNTLVADIIAQVAAGLAYAHSKGVVHSDLKPDNIFVTMDGRVKILDFGIARIVDSAIEKDNFDAGELGAMTLKYASLEMLEGKHQPHPSDDVYALGLIAYELFTGDHPFGGRNAAQALAKGLTPPAIRGATRRQARAINAALAFRQADRPQSAAQFLKSFSARASLNRTLLAVVLLLALSSGFLAFWAMQPEGPAVPFEELPMQVQAEFRHNIDMGRKSAEIGDWDGASRYFVDAYDLHPRNPEAEAGLDSLVNHLVRLEPGLTSQRQKKYLLSVIQTYNTNEHLANHAALSELRRRLEAQTAP